MTDSIIADVGGVFENLVTIVVLMGPHRRRHIDWVSKTADRFSEKRLHRAR
jgi:hypothetical protein